MIYWKCGKCGEHKEINQVNKYTGLCYMCEILIAQEK